MDSSHSEGTTSADALPEHVVAEHRQTLEAFVVRARRIESHSLLADRQQFVKWASGTVRLEGQRRTTSTGLEFAARTMAIDLPPEEAFESLAARVRPLTLQGERVHYGKVFGALRAFIRDDRDRRDRADALRDGWRKVKRPDNPILMGLVPALERPSGAASYVDVADAWLYADLVHCDPQRWEQVGRLPLSQRYFAAVMVYGQSALHAVATLNLIGQWQEDGVLDLDAAPLDQPVSVDVPLVLPVDKVNLIRTDP